MFLDRCTDRPRWNRARPTIVIDDITPWTNLSTGYMSLRAESLSGSYCRYLLVAFHFVAAAPAPRNRDSGSDLSVTSPLVLFPFLRFFFFFFPFSFLPSFSLSFGSFLPLFLFIRSYNGEFWEISRFLMRHRWKEKERKEIFNFGKISLASSVAILVLWLQLSVISDHVQFCFNADENRNNSFYIYFSFFWVKWFEKKYEIR